MILNCIPPFCIASQSCISQKWIAQVPSGRYFLRFKEIFSPPILITRSSLGPSQNEPALETSCNHPGFSEPQPYSVSLEPAPQGPPWGEQSQNPVPDPSTDLALPIPRSSSRHDSELKRLSMLQIASSQDLIPL